MTNEERFGNLLNVDSEMKKINTKKRKKLLTMLKEFDNLLNVDSKKSKNKKSKKVVDKIKKI